MACSDRPKKLQRISQACDLCHRRSIRCRPSNENPQAQCQNCYDFAVDCTYKRPSRRRRNPSLAQPSPPSILPSHSGAQIISPTSSGQSQEYNSGGPQHLSQRLSVTNSAQGPDVFGAVQDGSHEDVLGIAWHSFALASLNTIEQYVEIYLDVVYPIYPLFHAPTLRERIKQRHHLEDRGFFASVMAACALAAARARDGAIDVNRYHFLETPERSSDVFFAAAQDAVPKDLSRAQGLSFMRACALLALTSIQKGQIKTMHQHAGHYLTLLSMQQFYDEAVWPLHISDIEREERRRLFWSMYQLDIYTSVVFGCVLKSQETHSNVMYPSEVDDENMVHGLANTTGEHSWLRGWNFTVDLYRVLEHSIKRMRRIRATRSDRISIIRLLISDGLPENEVLDSVMGLYYALPERFRNYTHQPTGNRELDFAGIQAANIQATLQLVRMTLFSSSISYDISQKCDMAEQVLQVFQGINAQYLRAISTPLVFHLGGVGQILASVMEGVMCENSYRRVRACLASMADILQHLESGFQTTSGASLGLRRQIERIDEYMNAQRSLMTAQTMPQQRHPQQQPPPPPGPSGPAPTTVQIKVQDHPPPAHHLHQNGNISGNMNGNENGNGYHGHGHTNHTSNMVGTNGLGMHTTLDEFQLPQDLVQEGVWPWPFDFTHEHQIPGMPGVV